MLLLCQVGHLQAGIVFGATLMDRVAILLGEAIPTVLGRSASSILYGGVG